jgi:hypothetical protein
LLGHKAIFILVRSNIYEDPHLTEERIRIMKLIFWKHVLAVACLCIIATLFATLSSSRTAHAAPTRTAISCPGITYSTGKVWYPNTNGDWTTACDGGQLHLVYQNDGNFVLYCSAKPIWASNTGGSATYIAAYTTFQTDGNLVVYEYDYYGTPSPLWASGTYNKGATKLVLQGDGNLVIYNRSSQVLWASGTNGKC